MTKRILLVVFSIVAFSMALSGCADDSISDSLTTTNQDTQIIKQFRSNHGYTAEELNNLQIDYLGNVDEYRIYYVPFKGSSDDEEWVVIGYVFPPESHSRIVGVKNNRLSTIGELIYEKKIDIKALYDLVPAQFK